MTGRVASMVISMILTLEIVPVNQDIMEKNAQVRLLKLCRVVLKYQDGVLHFLQLMNVKKRVASMVINIILTLEIVLANQDMAETNVKVKCQE